MVQTDAFTPTVTQAQAEDVPVCQPDEIIHTHYWHMPLFRIDTWRPYKAWLHHSLFEGPQLRGKQRGLDLAKDLVGFAHGARGSCKSVTISFLLGKVMVTGKPVWTNYPISFYVQQHDDPAMVGKESNIFDQVSPCRWVNRDHNVSYYESMPLDLDKWYTFDQALRHGAVGITELQYFVESRTSGKYQNRVMGYQLMQIRKTANSFFYDVQDPAWVDKRFGWSADFSIECADLSKMNYDLRSTGGRYLDEGELAKWIIHDLSGVLTGTPYKKSGRDIGPFQFDAKRFWPIYPTHWIVDIFEAMAGPDRCKEKTEKESTQIKAVEDTINEYLADDRMAVDSDEFLSGVAMKLEGKIPNTVLGRMVKSIGVEKRSSGHNHFVYDFSKIVATLSKQ